jgi:hypothetical protein
MRNDVDLYLDWEPDSVSMRLQRREALKEFERMKDSLRHYQEMYRDLKEKQTQAYYGMRERVKEEIRYEVAQEIVEFLQLEEVRI